MGLVGALLFIPVIALAIVLAILAILLPWFVYRIKEELVQANKRLATLTHLVGSMAASRGQASDDPIELREEIGKPLYGP